MRNNELCDPVQSLEFVTASERRIPKEYAWSRGLERPSKSNRQQKNRAVVMRALRIQSTMGREPGREVAEAEDPPRSGTTFIARAVT